MKQNQQYRTLVTVLMCIVAPALSCQAQSWSGATYQGWSSIWLFGYSGYEASPYGDPDRDGAINYVEFARGTDPQSADTPHIEHLIPARNGADDGTIFGFQLMPQINEASWSYALSNDLVNWRNALPEATVLSTLSGDLETTTLTVADGDPAETAVFGRLHWHWQGGAVGDSMVEYSFTGSVASPTSSSTLWVVGGSYDVSRIGSVVAIPGSPTSTTLGSNGLASTNDTAAVPVTTWIRNDAPNDNKEDSQIFVGSLSGGADLRGLLAFDLSSIPDTATITSATVSLYQSGETTGNNDNEPSQNVDLELFSMTGAFTNNATWNSASGFFNSSLASSAGDPSITTAGLEHQFSGASVVAQIQNALVPNTAYFGLSSPDLESQSIRHFFVLDGATATSAIGPSLELTYTEDGGNDVAQVSSTETSSSLASALSGDDYHEFEINVTNPAGDLLTLLFDHYGSATEGDFTSNIAVFTSTDGFASSPQASDVLYTSSVSVTTSQSPSSPIETAVVELWQKNLSGALTVRFYFYDDANHSASTTSIDQIRIYGFSPEETLVSYDFNGGAPAAITNAPDSLTGMDYNVTAGALSVANQQVYIPTVETAATLAGAITNNDYQEFTVNITDIEAVLLSLKFDHLGSTSSSAFTSQVAVFSSSDGFATPPVAGNELHSSSVAVSTSQSATDPISSVSVPLAISQFTGTMTFRFYFFDDADDGSSFTRLDSIRLCGDAPQIIPANVEGIIGENYVVKITHPGFRIAVETFNGTALPADASNGLSFLGSAATTSERLSQVGDTTVYRVTNGTGDTALATLVAKRHTVELTVALENSQSGNITVRTASPGASYGLGDRGGWETNANLSSTQKTYPMKQNAHAYRFISSFLIFPEQGVAGACFEREDGSVSIGPNYYEMSNNSTSEQTFHFYLGSMEEIYSAYRDTRIAKGYPGVAPKMDAFELGWESWDLLRWNTTASTCQNAIQSFLSRGYNIEWAVTGSGFWQSRGTTLSFGLYDTIKYPDTNAPAPPDFGDWTSSQGIRWMIGQRTNFIPLGGPHSSNPGESGATLFDTSPNTQEGINNNYFLKDSNNNLVNLTSTVFPTVSCHMLDGNAPGAAAWFKNLYDGWGVDGVKEDTMMSVPDHTIYNNPMRLIAESGDLVMARCGAYSSPGSLTRVNDTSGASSMTRRTPINYLQYAASAAPNAYSDTVGFGGMSNVTSSLRHAWLLSLTAGMAVSDSPWNKGWSASNEAKFKKTTDFHYAIGPYMHSAAVDSHATGYPHTMTPLPIAFPQDTNTHNLASSSNRQFEWMIGPSLLAAPLLHSNYSSTSLMNVYLPAGKWIDYETGQVYQGPTTLSDFNMPLDKTPVFVGGKGILVLRDTSTQALAANIFPIANNGTSYTFTHPDGTSQSTFTNNNTGWNAASLIVTDTTASLLQSFTVNPTTGAISFDIIAGHNYEVTGGG